MMGEWIRFGIVAALFLAGLVTLYISILGTFKFKFALNRIHAAAMNDTLVLMLFLVACAVWCGWSSVLVKFLVLIFMQWCTSPITSHMLAKLEYLTDEHLDEYCDLYDTLTDVERGEDITHE